MVVRSRVLVWLLEMAIKEPDHLVKGEAGLGQTLVVPAVAGVGKRHELHVLAEGLAQTRFAFHKMIRFFDLHLKGPQKDLGVNDYEMD